MSVCKYNVTVRKHPVFLYMLSYDLFLKVLECLDENITYYLLYVQDKPAA